MTGLVAELSEWAAALSKKFAWKILAQGWGLSKSPAGTRLLVLASWYLPYRASLKLDKVLIS